MAHYCESKENHRCAILLIRLLQSLLIFSIVLVIIHTIHSTFVTLYFTSCSFIIQHILVMFTLSRRFISHTSLYCILFYFAMILYVLIWFSNNWSHFVYFPLGLIILRDILIFIHIIPFSQFTCILLFSIVIGLIILFDGQKQYPNH